MGERKKIIINQNLKGFTKQNKMKELEARSRLAKRNKVKTKELEKKREELGVGNIESLKSTPKSSFESLGSFFSRIGMTF